jgi:hypothetical protein
MLSPDTSTRSNCRHHHSHHAHPVSVTTAMTEPTPTGQGRLPWPRRGEIFFDASAPGGCCGRGGGGVASTGTGRLAAQSL